MVRSRGGLNEYQAAAPDGAPWAKERIWDDDEGPPRGVRLLPPGSSLGVQQLVCPGLVVLHI
jgi:hypothetical protein